MTEENKETQEISYRGDIKTQPQFGVSIMRDRSILLADDVKVLIDGSTKLGTFIFFRKQIIPSKGDAERTIQLGGINHELLLEVKVPITTILPLLVYMKDHGYALRNGRLYIDWILTGNNFKDYKSKTIQPIPVPSYLRLSDENLQSDKQDITDGDLTEPLQEIS
jgi:hypothetical protein